MAYTDTFLSGQRERLHVERTRLEAELSRIARKDPATPDDYDATFPDYGRDLEENALEEEEYVSRQSIEQQLELHLRDVHTALGRLDVGTYGLCTMCNTAIGEERLTAFPAALTCIEHA